MDISRTARLDHMTTVMRFLTGNEETKVKRLGSTCTYEVSIPFETDDVDGEVTINLDADANWIFSFVIPKMQEMRWTYRIISQSLDKEVEIIIRKPGRTLGGSQYAIASGTDFATAFVEALATALESWKEIVAGSEIK